MSQLNTLTPGVCVFVVCVGGVAVMYVQVHVCGGQRPSSGAFPQPWFGGQGLFIAWNSSSRLDWQAEECQGSSCLRAKIANACHLLPGPLMLFCNFVWLGWGGGIGKEISPWTKYCSWAASMFQFLLISVRLRCSINFYKVGFPASPPFLLLLFSSL